MGFRFIKTKRKIERKKIEDGGWVPAAGRVSLSARTVDEEWIDMGSACWTCVSLKNRSVDDDGRRNRHKLGGESLIRSGCSLMFLTQERLRVYLLGQTKFYSRKRLASKSATYKEI